MDFTFVSAVLLEICCDSELPVFSLAVVFLSLVKCFCDEVNSGEVAGLNGELWLFLLFGASDGDTTCFPNLGVYPLVVSCVYVSSLSKALFSSCAVVGCDGCGGRRSSVRPSSKSTNGALAMPSDVESCASARKSAEDALSASASGTAGCVFLLIVRGCCRRSVGATEGSTENCTENDGCVGFCGGLRVICGWGGGG